MKEIEVIVKKFEANDGTRFDDKESCDKYEEECKKINEALENRIAMIKAKRNKIDEEKAEIKKKNEIKYYELCGKIRSIGGRISGLISVANELLRNKMFPHISDYGYSFLNKYGYHYGDKISFGINKLNSYRSDYVNNDIKYIRVSGLGIACTDGECFEFYDLDGSEDAIGSRCRMLEWILEDFDVFEKAFYAYVDNIIK